MPQAENRIAFFVMWPLLGILDGHHTDHALIILILVAVNRTRGIECGGLHQLSYVPSQ